MKELKELRDEGRRRETGGVIKRRGSKEGKEFEITEYNRGGNKTKQKKRAGEMKMVGGGLVVVD